MLTKPNMLVVDNDVAILNKCSQLLLSGGYQVRAAESSKEALYIDPLWAVIFCCSMLIGCVIRLLHKHTRILKVTGR